MWHLNTLIAYLNYSAYPRIKLDTYMDTDSQIHTNDICVCVFVCTNTYINTHTYIHTHPGCLTQVTMPPTNAVYFLRSAAPDTGQAPSSSQTCINYSPDGQILLMSAKFASIANNGLPVGSFVLDDLGRQSFILVEWRGEKGAPRSVRYQRHVQSGR